MTAVFQPSLLDLDDRVEPGPLGATVRRMTLSRGAWIDLRPGWMRGADTLFQRLVERVPWRVERRRMYDRVVDVPRLGCFYDEYDELPHPVRESASATLRAHYRHELGE